MLNRLRIGTRGSLLARTQTELMAADLRTAHPDLEISTEIITTTGDARRDVPFAQVGTKGMFVKEIEEALLAGTIDVGVHSLKDMPAELPEGLELTCIPVRESPLDALLSRDDLTLDHLPVHAIVGTSSVRRQAQLRAARPDLRIVELRGNLDTRLRKLDEGQYDAIVLACAGLNRLGLGHRVTQKLPPAVCLPAVGQGALALESRTVDRAVAARLAALHSPDTAVCIAAERGFQAGLNGGCSVPAGAYAILRDDTVELQAMIAAPDGSRILRERMTATRSRAQELGLEMARRLLERGGGDLLKG